MYNRDVGAERNTASGERWDDMHLSEPINRKISGEVKINSFYCFECKLKAS